MTLTALLFSDRPDYSVKCVWSNILCIKDRNTKIGNGFVWLGAFTNLEVSK